MIGDVYSVEINNQVIMAHSHSMEAGLRDLCLIFIFRLVEIFLTVHLTRIQLYHAVHKFSSIIQFVELVA